MKNSTRAELADIAHRWIDEGWKKGNVTAIDDMHAPEFIDHDCAGRRADREGFKQGIISLYAAFPDFRCAVNDLVVEEASCSVTVRWSGEGTHRGTYLGSSPTGQNVRFKGIEIIRVVDGLITERWGEWDGIDLLVQLGLATLPSTPDAGTS